MLDTPFRVPFVRSKYSRTPSAIWRIPRTMLPSLYPYLTYLFVPISPINTPAAIPHPHAISIPALSNSISPIITCLLAAPCHVCHAFCALQPSLHPSHSNACKPSSQRSPRKLTISKLWCGPLARQHQNTWQLSARDCLAILPAIVVVAHSSEAGLVSRVQTQSSAPILRSLAWSFAGSETGS